MSKLGHITTLYVKTTCFPSNVIIKVCLDFVPIVSQWSHTFHHIFKIKLSNRLIMKFSELGNNYLHIKQLAFFSVWRGIARCICHQMCLSSNFKNQHIYTVMYKWCIRFTVYDPVNHIIF